MEWTNILKRKKPVPPKNVRDVIDEFMSSVDGKTSVRDVNQHVLKKLGVLGMSQKPRAIRNYLFGWHSDKIDSFDPNTMRSEDYYYDLGE